MLEEFLSKMFVNIYDEITDAASEGEFLNISKTSLGIFHRVAFQHKVLKKKMFSDGNLYGILEVIHGVQRRIQEIWLDFVIQKSQCIWNDLKEIRKDT